MEDIIEKLRLIFGEEERLYQIDDGFVCYWTYGKKRLFIIFADQGAVKVGLTLDKENCPN